MSSAGWQLFLHRCGGINASFIVLPPPLPSRTARASGLTSEPRRARASCTMSKNFATSSCRKAGSSAKISTTNASKAQNTTKPPGPSASAHFCNSCIPRRSPQYNPRYFRAHGFAGMTDRPLTILCVSSYEKGQEFLRTCKALGCRVLLLTVEKLRNADWPRESLDDVFLMPEDLSQQHLLYTVSYVARLQPIDRIVALDEFDME